MKLSIVVPVYNEAGNVEPLIHSLKEVLGTMRAVWEIVVVDDGSTDATWHELKEAAVHEKNLKIVRFVRNFGQSAALAAGVAEAQGDVIITIDGDLENRPEDIPVLLGELKDHADVVCGWRKERWTDQKVLRRAPSRAANWLLSRITGLSIHDFGCTLRAYRREFIQDVALYGEMHRFLPFYAKLQGARITEVPVGFRARTRGTSKYGFSRMYKVMLDLVVIVFLNRYMTRPMHFFGGVGFLSLFLGGLAGLWALWFKFFGGKSLVATPLPVFSALLVIVGIQLIIMGIIGEILMRTYYESQRAKPYRIKETVNLLKRV